MNRLVIYTYLLPILPPALIGGYLLTCGDKKVKERLESMDNAGTFQIVVGFITGILFLIIRFIFVDLPFGTGYSMTTHIY